MLNTQTQTQTRPLTIAIQESALERLELCRLLAAATVNREYEDLLIHQPRAALEQGYQGEQFLLTREEQDLICSIHADSLAELAQILVRTIGARDVPRNHYPARSEQYLIR